MNASQIRLFKERLEKDPENQLLRRQFHENYEWVEAYWSERYSSNEIDQFSSDFGSYFWEMAQIKEIATTLSGYPPVANAKRDFAPTPIVERATYHLYYFANLRSYDFPNNEDQKNKGRQWNKSSFNALLTIVKQVRDNLFHGKKMEIEEPQYQRNKELISMANEVAIIVLDHLEDAESQLLDSKNL